MIGNITSTGNRGISSQTVTTISVSETSVPPSGGAKSIADLLQTGLRRFSSDWEQSEHQTQSSLGLLRPNDRLLLTTQQAVQRTQLECEVVCRLADSAASAFRRLQQSSG